MPRRDETFIVYYREDYSQYLDDNPGALVCLSESTIQLCLSALRFAGWPTRWRIDRGDHNPRVSGAIWEEVKKWQNLAIQELIMSCEFPDLNPGLEAIAAAISSLSASNQQTADLIKVMVQSNVCCEQTIINQGGFVAGGITQGSGENVPIYGINPPLEVAPGTFPEGYTSENEYLLDKCQVANLIFDGFIASLRSLAALGVFNGVALVGLVIASIAGALIFPPAAIPIACAAIGVLSVGVTILAVVADEIETNRAEWVCALYQSESVSSAVEAVADLMDALIATLGVSSPVGIAIKSLVLVLLNGETLNQLMTKVAHLNYPGADCSSCGDCNNSLLTLSIGAILEDDEGLSIRTITINSTDHNPGGGSRQTISFFVPLGCEIEILSCSVVSGTWTGMDNTGNCTSPDLLYGYHFTCDTETLEYVCGVNDFLSGVTGINNFGLYSVTGFTVELQIRVVDCTA